MNGQNKTSVLMSSCLLGSPVRYDGTTVRVQDSRMKLLQERYTVVPICPELEAGLGVPRSPVEIIEGKGEDVLVGTAKVVTSTGEDVTKSFIGGAEQALALCRKENIRVAILTENSPSCGSGRIYNGSFSGVKIVGSGVTTALLQRHGITVFSQNQLHSVIEYLEAMQESNGA